MKKEKRKKSWKKRLLWYGYILLLIPVCLELCLWIVGGRPYSEEVYHIDIQPKNAFVGDNKLGIALAPGTFDITLNKEVKFRSTHLPSKERLVTHKSEVDLQTTQVAVLGCSYTYGYGVNDDEHYTSLLQQALPDHNFRNLGVIGYGTSQSYLQCKELCQLADKPDKIVLLFSAAHFDRNTMTPQYRRAMGIGFKRSMDHQPEEMKTASFPYFELENGKLKQQSIKWSEMYEDWWGRSYSASVNWLQTQWELFERDQLEVVEVTAALIKAMQDETKAAGIEFEVFLLDESEETKELSLITKKEGFKLNNLNFNFNKKELTNAPYDQHPNADGHRFIADEILKTWQPQ